MGPRVGALQILLNIDIEQSDLPACLPTRLRNTPNELLLDANILDAMSEKFLLDELKDFFLCAHFSFQVCAGRTKLLRLISDPIG